MNNHVENFNNVCEHLHKLSDEDIESMFIKDSGMTTEDFENLQVELAADGVTGSEFKKCLRNSVLLTRLHTH